MESDPGRAIISNGPKCFSNSFFDGRVEQKYLAFTNTCSPTLKSRAGSDEHLQVLDIFSVQETSLLGGIGIVC
jgi:hypothetical protein